MQIDIHTHAFADRIAERAIAALHANIAPEHHTLYDGRLASLIAELKKFGFDHAMICQIATKPSQFEILRDWAEMIRGGDFGEDAARMIVPTLSVHPADEKREEHLKEVAARNFKGVKLHPYFQKFELDSPDIIDYFKMVRDNGLFAIIHAGYDIGFPLEEICGPRRVLRVLENVPGLRLMVSHFGGWKAWKEVDEMLIGAPVDMEMSMTVGFCEPELIKRMLVRHPQDHLYFGSDWPWSRYDKVLPFLESCDISPERRAALMGGNAERFLRLTASN